MLAKKLNILFVASLGLLASCQSNVNPGGSKDKDATLPPNVHKVVTEDVIQTTQYTYLKVKENNTDEWLALPSMVSKPGETYYYTGGLVMTNFNSKELNRTFDKIIFLQRVVTDPNAATAPDNAAAASQQPAQPAMGGGNDTVNPQLNNESYKRSVTPQEKKVVKIEPVKGGVSIKELFAHKKNYEGKVVKVRGQVTKFTPAVMNKNWIHIQDGTEQDGKFDLAITSDGEVNVGDNVVFEGKISLDKDLGYGYFFEVIMEDATVKK
jgi:hypothetical protein